MADFFVDYENVHFYGLEGSELLSEEDKVFVFYSDNANCMANPEPLRRADESDAYFEFIKVAAGKLNALDFHLIMFLGLYLNNDTDSYIISKDGGYDAAAVL